MSTLSSLFLGTGYKNILDIQKRVEDGVLRHMQNTSDLCVCLPDFLKKDVSLSFALDNIDMLEDTPYGQNTFHGVIMVLNQPDDQTALPVQPPFTIPSKLPSKRLKVDVKYLEEPTLVLRPITFSKYTHGSRSHLLNQYKRYTHTWMLASCLGDARQTDTDNADEGDKSLAKSSSTSDPLTVISESLRNAESTEMGKKTSSSDLEPPRELFPFYIGPKVELSTESDPTFSAEIEEPADISEDIVQQQSITGEVPEDLTKQSVMPTWSATKSLLLLHQGGKLPPKINSEVVTPLFRTPPTDLATLYTALKLTQNISAIVVGPERRTLITLDLDLFNRALQIQVSTKNKNWILKPGGLHLCFAALHALGKQVEGSGMDTVAVEMGVYSVPALRNIYGGKAFKRGVEYHIMMSAAIMMMKFDVILSELPTGPVSMQCVELKKALHD